MAGDWFPLQYWRSRCPEIVLVGTLTTRDRHQVLGWLCDLWSWVSSESEDGKVKGVFVRDLVAVIGADAELWAAVVRVGWLAEDGAGLVIPHWENWLSESAKKRHKERSKKRKQRAKEARKPVPKVSPVCPEVVPDLSPKCPPNVPPTGQDITGQKKSKREDPPCPPQSRGEGRDPVPAVVIPPALDTPEFRAAWAGWKAERRAQKRKPYTPTGEAAALADLAKYGPAVAVETIAESTRNTWQGLFPEKVAQKATGPPKPFLDKTTQYAIDTLTNLFGDQPDGRRVDDSPGPRRIAAPGTDDR